MSKEILDAVMNVTNVIYTMLGGTMVFSRYEKTSDPVSGSIAWSKDLSVGDIEVSFAPGEYTFTINQGGIGVRTREPVFYVAKKPFSDRGLILDSNWRIISGSKEYKVQIPIIEEDGTYYIVRYSE